MPVVPPSPLPTLTRAPRRRSSARAARLPSAAAALVLALGPGASPRADDAPPIPAPLRTTVQAVSEALVQGIAGGPGGSPELMFGLTIGRELVPHLAAEGTAGLAGNGRVLGTHLGAALRLGLPRDGARPGGITAALGGHALLLRGYGLVSFAHAEVAFEFRNRSGTSILIGGGPTLALTTSRFQEKDDNNAIATGYRAGALGLRVRCAAGLAF